MKGNFKDLIKKIGRFFFKFIIKNVAIFKPFFILVGSKARTSFKEIIVKLVFEKLYSNSRNNFFDLINSGITLGGVTLDMN